MSIRKLVMGMDKTPDEIEFDYLIKGIENVKCIRKNIYVGNLGEKSYAMFRLKTEVIVSAMNETISEMIQNGDIDAIEAMLDFSNHKILSFYFGEDKIKAEFRNEDVYESLIEVKKLLNDN